MGMGNDLEALHGAVDQLAALDLDTVDDEALHLLVVGITRQRDRLAAVHARALARWEARQLWQSDGSRSAASRLARDTQQSTNTTRAELGRARRLTHLPTTSAAAIDGRLSLDQVDLMVSAHQPHRRSHMAADEAGLVATCSTLSAAQSKRLLAYWGQRVDAAVGYEGRPAEADNHVHLSDTINGVVMLNGQLDPLGGAAVRNELARLADQLRLADLEAGVDRTPAQRRAAALVQMAIRSASTSPDSRRPRPLFTVQLGDDSFQSLCELAAGTVITPGDLLPWLTDADLETVLFDGPSTVLSVSHRRTFTGALRRAIEVRDRHCQHSSGCEVPADRCDVDHIVPYSQGGVTDQFNGRLQCPTHNRRSELHDHGAVPPPRRTVMKIDVVRAQIRWRLRHLKAHTNAA